MSEEKSGSRLPDFELPDQHGNTFRLADARARGPVVLFFYPRDFTLGCTAEACAFRDAHAEFQQAGATVVGISSDDVASHARFASKHALPYPLLADVGGKLRASLGQSRAMFGLVDARVTYVIDRDGVIRHRHEAMLQAQGHVDEAIAVIRRIAQAPTGSRATAG